MKKLKSKSILLFTTFLIITFANLLNELNLNSKLLAQENENIPPSPTDIISHPLLTNREIYLTTAVLCFSLVVIFFNFVLLWKVPEVITPENLLVNFTITLIVVGTMYLITAGFSGDDIAPALGLFGTLVGYLLGRESVLNNRGKKNNGENREENEKDRNS